MVNINNDIENIIRDGVTAPSGDNLQPWRFLVTENVIKVYAISPPDNNQILGGEISSIYLSHGALIENILIAASHYGYIAQIELLPSVKDPLHTADIRLLKDANVKEDTLYKYLSLRVTDRKKYTKESITNLQKNILLKVVESFDFSARISIVDDRGLIKKMSRAVVAQIILLFSNKLLHKEFYQSLRWNRFEVNHSQDGLDIKTLELNLIEQFIFRYVISSWSTTYILSFLQIHHIIALVENFIYTTGTYCGIILKDDTNINLLNAGRLQERVWLVATELGLSVQPTFATPLIKRVSDKKPGFFSKSQRNLLLKKAEQMNQIFSIDGSERLLFAFRLGKSSQEPTRSLRKEPDITWR